MSKGCGFPGPEEELDTGTELASFDKVFIANAFKNCQCIFTFLHI
jgi:hypothetical protein